MLARARAYRWLEVPEAVREVVKTQMIQTLLQGTPIARKTAAQVIAAIGSIEIPEGQWKELVPGLVSTLRNPEIDYPTRLATLKAIAYLADELDDAALDQDAIDDLLTVVVGSLDVDQPLDVVREAIAAMNAMLDFVSVNFNEPERLGEREAIINSICRVSTLPDHDTRMVAFECIANLAALYYANIKDWMPRFYDLTTEVIRGDDEEVALMALEFWTQIGEIEVGIKNGDVESESHNFIATGLAFLTPVFLELLLKRDEDEDDDSVSLPVMGGACLRNLCRVAGPAAAEHVMPFITAHFDQGDWKARDAATLALGNLIEGCQDSADLEPVQEMVRNAFVQLMQRLSIGDTLDRDPRVRDTSAWAVGLILRYYLPLIDPAHLEATVRTLETALQDEPRVVANVCFALHNLMLSVSEATDNEDSTPMTPFVNDLLKNMFAAYDRDDAVRCKMREAIHETIVAFIQCGKREELEIYQSMMPFIMDRISTIGAAPTSNAEETAIKDEMLTHYASILAALFDQVSDVTQDLCDQAMGLMVDTWDLGLDTSHEDAILTIGRIVLCAGEEAGKYVSALKPRILAALNKLEERDTFLRSLGLVTELSIALGARFEEHARDFIVPIFAACNSPYIHRNLSPPLLSAIGDIAMAIGPAFEPWVAPSFAIFVQAQAAAVDNSNEELVEWLTKLRISVLDAYQSIVQAFNDDRAHGKEGLMLSYVPTMGKFLSNLANELKDVEADQRDSTLLVKMASLIGDLAQTFSPARIRESIRADMPWVEAVCNWASAAEREAWGDEPPRDDRGKPKPPTGEWALAELRKRR